jgi:hypothetical protein
MSITFILSENIYDEPSIPNPSHRELEVKRIPDSEASAHIEIMGNLSYASLSVVEDLELTGCPAYIRSQDANLVPVCMHLN